LLGLNGGLGRVVFIVDRSGSQIPYFAEIARIVVTYLRLLPIGAFSVISFAGPGQTDIFSKELVAPSEEMRAAAGEYVMNMHPGGRTDLLSALVAADEFRPTDIILFTDGR